MSRIPCCKYALYSYNEGTAIAPDELEMNTVETLVRTTECASVTQTMRALLGIRELIFDGELRSGDRVSELWLVERLGVSRTPVRAALIRLEDEGLIESLAGRGVSVRSFTEDEICDSIEMRGTLEGLAARLAAERGVTASLLSQLRVCVGEIDQLLIGELTEQTFRSYVEYNTRFHRLLATASGSRAVAHQIDKVTSLPFASASAFVAVQALDPRAREILVVGQAQHHGVLEAIGQREGTRAEAIMREHSRIAHQNLNRALESQAVRSRLLGGNLICKCL